MKVVAHTTAQIIGKLREVERLQAEGKSIAEACKQIAVSEHTFYKWRKRFGGMQETEAKRLKELETENARLKRLVADQALDNLKTEGTCKGKLSRARRVNAGRYRHEKRSSRSPSGVRAASSDNSDQANATRNERAVRATG